MPSDVVGTTIFDPRGAEFHFRGGPVFCHVLLADEVNRAPPRPRPPCWRRWRSARSRWTASHPLPDPFLVVATQNPVEYEGTYPLPEAQLDGSCSSSVMPLPSREDEIAVLQRHGERVRPAEPRRGRRPARVAGAADLGRAARAAAERLTISRRSSRTSPTSAGPRGMPAVDGSGCRPAARRPCSAASRAWAWLSGRSYVPAGRREVPGPTGPAAPDRVARRGRARGRDGGRRPRGGAGGRAGAPVSHMPGTAGKSAPAHPGTAGKSMALTGRAGLLAVLGALGGGLAGTGFGAGRWLADRGPARRGRWSVDLVRRPGRRPRAALRPVRTHLRPARRGTAPIALTVTNPGRRRVRGRLRDAWPPSGRAPR